MSGKQRSSLIISLTTRRTCAVVSAGDFFKLDSHSHQEEMGDERVCHMMMPPAPRARLVMIHAAFAFALFECRLDRPAHATEMGKPTRRTRPGCVAQVILDLARGTQAATKNRPQARSRQTVAHARHAHEGKLCMERTLTPLMNAEGTPCRLGHRSRESLHVLCAGRIQFHARVETRSPQRAASGQFDGWRVQPDAHIARHFCEIPFAQSRNRI